MRFVDTNVLLYAISRDPEEQDQAKRANEILAGRELALSVQVLQEFYVQATRASRPDPLTHTQAAALVESFLRFPVVEVTTGVMLAALRTRRRFDSAGALILGGVAVDPVAARRPGRRRTPPLARGGSFPLGVASGQPSPRGISLWTRLEGFDSPQRLRLEVARDPDFRRVIERRVLRRRARARLHDRDAARPPAARTRQRVLLPLRDARPDQHGGALSHAAPLGLARAGADRLLLLPGLPGGLLRRPVRDRERGRRPRGLPRRLHLRAHVLRGPAARFTPCPEAESEPRRFLGRRQLDWLKRGLRESSATWKLIGNQLMIMSLDSVPKTPIGKDSWDGYGLERRELMTHIAARGINDVSFLTGDIHTFFAGEVGLDGRGPERHATEFVGGSITSLGIPETLEATTGAPPAGRDALALVGRNLLVTNPHLRYLDEKNRGYGIVEATQQELRVQFKAVDAMQRSSAARTIGSFRVPSGSPRVEVV